MASDAAAVIIVRMAVLRDVALRSFLVLLANCDRVFAIRRLIWEAETNDRAVIFN